MGKHQDAFEKLREIGEASKQPMEDSVNARMAVFCGWHWSGHWWLRGGEHEPFTPAYTASLDLCAEAEARIISMGLGEKYAEALEGEDWVTWDKNSDYENETDYAALARIATASAEARCRAMLATLEGK